MIPNCKGCDEDFSLACDYVRDGYHIATTKYRTGINERVHFFLWVVDDNGKVIIG